METRLATSQLRMQSWANIIKDRNASGLSVNEYCRQHDLSRNAYFYWLRKIRSAVIESGGVRLMEAPFTPESTVASFRPRLTMQIGDITIGADTTTTRELLTMACEVASHVK